MVIFIIRYYLVMTFFDWINTHNKEAMEKVRNICKDPDQQDDLYQSVVEQLLSKPKKINEIPDSQKMYYFIRVVKNNFNSNTSYYHKVYRKNQNFHTPLLEDITEGFIDEEYTETIPDMKWVHRQLETFDWFDRDLFLLWLEMGTLTNVSKQTQIPLNSVGRYINKTKKKLQELWQRELGN